MLQAKAVSKIIKKITAIADLKTYTTDTAIDGSDLCKELWLYMNYLILKSCTLYPIIIPDFTASEDKRLYYELIKKPTNLWAPCFYDIQHTFQHCTPLHSPWQSGAIPRHVYKYKSEPSSGRSLRSEPALRRKSIELKAVEFVLLRVLPLSKKKRHYFSVSIRSRGRSLPKINSVPTSQKIHIYRSHQFTWSLLDKMQAK
jgi:hypothetical protein